MLFYFYIAIFKVFLLNALPIAESEIRIEKIHDTFNNIRSGEFSLAKIEAAVRQMKNGKAPGLDGLSPESWKLPKVKKSLLSF